MKHFILRFFVFLIAPISLFVIVENLIYQNKDRLISEINLEQVFKRKARSYHWVDSLQYSRKVYLLGSSSVRYGLSCSQLNKLSSDSLAFVNLAMDARDPVETYYILKEIGFKNVREVYFGVDPWIFTKVFYSNKNKVMYYDLTPGQTFGYFCLQDPSAYLKKYRNLYAFFFNNGFESDIKSIHPKTPPDFGSVKLKGKPKNFNGEIREWFKLPQFGWSDLQFVYLMKIVDLCNQNKVKFYPFYPPKRSDYCKSYLAECSDIQMEFNQLLLMHGFKNEIFGSFSDLITRGDSSLFAEAFHLNAKGQEVYSKVFYDSIVMGKEK